METTILVQRDGESLRDLDTHSIRPFSIYNSTEGRNRDLFAIVAADLNGAIGSNGQIPWHISEDFKRFKALTLGHPVIMGRKTWESLPRRPLPGRRNIVITRNPEYIAEGAETALSTAEALALCAADEVPFIIGGATIYAELYDLCTRIYLTRVHLQVADADAHFATPSPDLWHLANSSDLLTAPDGTQYQFLDYHRRS